MTLPVNGTRQKEISTFLEAADWGKAKRSPVPGDASARRYERLQKKDGRRAVLMDVPNNSKDKSQPVVNLVDVSAAQRRTLGYSAMARLAGSSLEAFTAIADALSSRGFSAPRILAVDLKAGLMLLEDLGAHLYARVIETSPEMEAPLYEAAIDVLAAIYRASFPSMIHSRGAYGAEYKWALQDYDEMAFLAELDLCLDWYGPDVGRVIKDKHRENFYDLWRAAFTALSAHAPGLALRDFHAENLFWLPARDGVARVGLIDFQDALFVHPAYDLVSFLEDARRDVSLALHEPLIKRFCEKAGLKYDDSFRAAYAVMGAQRNSKVIGFPVRADLKFGKPQYRPLIPRVRAHLNRNLSHPALKDIRRWYKNYIPEILDD